MSWDKAERGARFVLLLVLVMAEVACGVGSSSSFVLVGASVDATYACPAGSNNAAYDLHATIDTRNGTSSTVTIRSVSAVMTLAAVKGGWLEHVGDKYDAAGVTFSPTTVAAGASKSLTVTIPSACTNAKSAPTGAGYGEYSVALKVATSSGTYSITSKNRHRILAG